MSAGPSSIQPLSARTVSLLQASQSLPSLPATLSYLLLHLLELAPAASQLSITLDPARWAVKIQLDGEGLEPAAYDQVAACQGLGLVGRVGLLELEGRNRTGAQRTCIVKGGTVLHDSTSITGSLRQGTTLKLRDLFYNVPVRRRSAPSPAALQARCLRFVEQLSLSRFWLAFRVWEPGKEDPLWRVQAASSAEERFAQLHGSALLKTPTTIAASSPSSSSQTLLRLTGFISLSATHSRSTEYFSLNHRPLTSPDSALHTLIADLFANSAFAERAQAETEPGLSAASPVKLGRGAANERSPRKAVRRPVYVLDLTVPPNQVIWEGGSGDAVDFEDWPRVKAFVTSVVRDFLEQNGFLRSLSSASPSAKRRLVFDAVSSNGHSTLVKKLKQEGSPLKQVSAQSSVSTADRNVVSYRDPTTKKVFKLDRHTGTSLAIGPPERPADDEQASGSIPSWLREVLERWVNPTFPVAATEARIPSIACPPLNPKTAPSLPFHSVSSVSQTAHDLSAAQLQQALRTAEVVAQVDRKFLACVLRAPAPATLLSGDTHRRLLFLIDQHAADERIRVETYLRELASGFFTNCRRETAGPLDAIPLVKPTTEVYILLTAAERQALASSTTVQLVFARWGVTFDLPPTLPADCDVQTRVLSVPSVVAERLLGRRYLKEGPAELTELIKSYLAWLDEEGGAESVCAAAASAAMGRGADFGRAEDDSMGALRFCPREILDLINSKACRGAIMFGDRLSLAQAADLVRRLAQTRLPLQCAHGRPSMALVADLGGLQRRSPRAERRSQAIDWDKLAPLVTSGGGCDESGSLGDVTRKD